MRGLLGGAVGKGGDKGGPPEGAAATETEELDEHEGSILMGMISQLRPGMELSRITFPTFVLEPRSMLERITDFLSHPDLIFGAGQIEDPHERFVSVLRYYLAGWHIKPKGVKKPYNPVLGETFRCRYKYKDGTQGFYIAEQVSHHPPISAFYYVSPENKIEVFGELKPKSRFLGNSVMNEMSGANHIVLLDRPEDGTYDITMPNQYARGILFGKMVLELGDIAKVSNANLGISCDVDFKTKGFFSGSYNTIAGKIKTDKGEIGEISGKWSDQMYIQRGKGQKELFFDANTAVAVPKEVIPEEEQPDTESRKLWSKVSEAIKKGDQDAATDSKSAIEDRQRELAKLREDAGEDWKPHHFHLEDGEYRVKFKVPEGSVEEQIEAVEMFIFGTTTPKTQEDTVQAAQPAAAIAAAAPAPPAAATEQGAVPQAQAQARSETPAKTKTQPNSAISTPVGAVAMTAQNSHNSSAEASSPEGSHGHGHFFKLGSNLRKHTGSVSIPYFSNSKSPPPLHNPPDHEASSRHVPPPKD